MSRNRRSTAIRQALNDKQIATQGKVYKKWMNSILKARNVEITNVIEDLKQGYQFFHLLEILSGKTLPSQKWKTKKVASPRKTSSQKFNRISELNLLLSFIADEGIALTLIATDIQEGNAVLIFGLIWMVILKYQNISRNTLLEWTKKSIESFEVKLGNFTSHWVDGTAFVALVASLDDKAINFEKLKEASPETRIKKAVNTAHKKFGIPKLLEVSDVYPGPPDENVVMMYVSFFKNHTKKPKPRVDPRDIKIDDQDKTIQNLTTAVSNISKAAEEKDKVVKSLSAKVDIIPSLKKTISTQDETIERLKAELEASRKKEESSNQVLQKLKNDQIPVLRQALKEKVQRVGELVLQLKELQTKDEIILQLKDAVEDKEKSIGDLTKEMRNVLQMLRDTKAALVAVTKKSKTYVIKLAELKSIIDAGGELSLEDQLQDLKIKMEEQQNKIMELQQQLLEAEKQARALQANLSKAQGASDSDIENSRIVQELLAAQTSMRDEIDEARDTNAELRELLEFLNTNYKTLVKDNKVTTTSLSSHEASCGATVDDLQELLETNKNAIESMINKLQILKKEK